MEAHEEHDRLADALESEADRLQQRSDELGDKIKDVRDDWERKRSDGAVPGAPPRTGEADLDDAGGDDAGHEDAGAQDGD